MRTVQARKVLGEAEDPCLTGLGEDCPFPGTDTVRPGPSVKGRALSGLKSMDHTCY